MRGENDHAAPVPPLEAQPARRIEILERHVQAQQKTLDRALEIVASYFDRVERGETPDLD